MDLWLPLTQDTRQQGLSNASVTAVGSGATINANGKLGKCYYLDGTSNGYITTDFPTNFGTNDFTISLWVKIPTISSGTYYTIVSSKQSPAISVGVGIYWHYGSKKFLWSTADGTNATEIWMADAVDTIVYDKWIHLVMVRDNNDSKKGCFYINGTRYELASVPTIRNITTATNLWVGKLSSGNYPLKMYISDIRVWNGKALSPKEIEVLSRGLVCHYPLEGANNTLLPFGYQQLEYIESSGASAFDTKYKFNPETDSIKMIFKGNDVSNNGMLFGQSAGRYFWLYYYGSNGIRVYAHNGTSQEGISGIPSDLIKHTAEFKNKHYIIDGVDKGGLSNTYTEEAYSSWMFSYGNASYCFKGRIYYAQIGRNGKVQRTFIPAKRLSDSKIGMYELNTNEFFPSGTSTAFTAGDVVGTPSTVYDCSGYQYNGTINGSLSISNDTPRYSASAEFSKAGNISNGSFGLTTNAFTVNFWVKLKTAASQHFVLGTFNNWTGNGFGLYREANGTTYQSLIRSTAESTYKQHTMALTGSVWQMLTYVYTGTHYMGYLNGVLKFDDTYGLNGNVSHPVLVLANSYYNGTPASENEEAFLSDFRFYATALSDTQIAELYNTAVSVANNGALLGYELVEV